MESRLLIFILRSYEILALSCLLTGVRDATFCGSLQRIRDKSEKGGPGDMIAHGERNYFGVPRFLLNFHEKRPSVSKRWVPKSSKYLKISELLAS